jgi:hypothetical protein
MLSIVKTQTLRSNQNRRHFESKQTLQNNEQSRLGKIKIEFISAVKFNSVNISQNLFIKITFDEKATKTSQ